MSEQRLIDANNFDFMQQITTSAEVFLTIRKFLETAPTVDAVPVVRCKDCKYSQGCKNAQHLGMDGFCSYGERKE